MGKMFDHDRVVYVSVTVFTCLAAVFDMIKTLPEGLRNSLHLDGIVEFARRILPWFDLNLGWVAPAAAGLVIGLIIQVVQNKK